MASPSDATPRDDPFADAPRRIRFREQLSDNSVSLGSLERVPSYPAPPASLEYDLGTPSAEASLEEKLPLTYDTGSTESFYPPAETPQCVVLQPMHSTY
jgi:hypothetical protein